MNQPVDDYFDCLIFIGRFQPFHTGHLAVIRAGLERCGLMLVIVGSARQPRSVRNPWPEQERAAMIRGALTAAENNRVHIVPLEDDWYDDAAWARQLESKVSAMIRTLSGITTAPLRIGLIGDEAIHTGYCPVLCPQWERLVLPKLDQCNGTAVRERLFGAVDSGAALAWLAGTESQLPAHVIQTLRKFCATPDYAGLKGEYDFILSYRNAWRAAPFPPVFVTVDAVVTHGRQLLLIKRNNYPGKGLWALPGGFINQHEVLVDACIRELLEETRIALTAAALKECIRTRRVFDYPYRSLLGRIITHAFHFDLEALTPLPAVRGGDDASHARWTPLADLDPALLHDDHYFIIRQMTGTVQAAGR